MCGCVSRTGDPAGQFRIDHLSGLISTTVVSLDREVEEEYTLRVRVTDIGERTVSANTLYSPYTPCPLLRVFISANLVK